MLVRVCAIRVMVADEQALPAVYRFCKHDKSSAATSCRAAAPQLTETKSGRPERVPSPVDPSPLTPDIRSAATADGSHVSTPATGRHPADHQLKD